MYYQEAIINGQLCSRTSPTGAWQALVTPRAQAVNALLALSEEDRARALEYFR